MTHQVGHKATVPQKLAIFQRKIEARLWDLFVCNHPEKESVIIGARLLASATLGYLGRRGDLEIANASHTCFPRRIYSTVSSALSLLHSHL